MTKKPVVVAIPVNEIVFPLIVATVLEVPIRVAVVNVPELLIAVEFIVVGLTTGADIAPVVDIVFPVSAPMIAVGTLRDPAVIVPGVVTVPGADRVKEVPTIGGGLS